MYEQLYSTVLVLSFICVETELTLYLLLTVTFT